jgi:hypothetical protein
LFLGLIEILIFLFFSIKDYDLLFFNFAILVTIILSWRDINCPILLWYTCQRSIWHVSVIYILKNNINCLILLRYTYRKESASIGIRYISDTLLDHFECRNFIDRKYSQKEKKIKHNNNSRKEKTSPTPQK